MAEETTYEGENPETMLDEEELAAETAAQAEEQE